MHPSAQKIADAALKLGLNIEIVEFAQTTRTAQEAAEAIGCTVAQIVKSLCFEVNDTARSPFGFAVISLVSGANQLAEKKLAALCGVSRKQVNRANAEFVKEQTGFSIGGVPPFGHERPLPIYIDEDLLTFEVVWAAAGTPFAVFAISPTHLQTASNGTVANLKRDDVL
jgi:prolyl-tRNA editing enzyme YbaK/EbsC (Cys-tRNA(Pro) deacylase)